MTRELIIEGQHIDLAPDTDITLEYASNLLNEPGKLNLAHSYTIKVPRTLHNSRILGMPENPTNTQSLTRQFLSARYYRNGIDLLGPARAYIAKTTSESYEIVLVSQTLAALQTLIDSKATLNDLKGLPELQWIGADGKKPDYSSEEFGFAHYQSGLPVDSFPQFNAAPHPYARVIPLIRLILENAGIPFTFDDNGTGVIDGDLYDTVLLAAPSHKPDDAMELRSGLSARSMVVINGTSQLIFTDLTTGWDSPPLDASVPSRFGTLRPNSRKFRIRLNICAPPGEDWGQKQVALVYQDLNASDGSPVNNRVIKFWNASKDTTGAFYFQFDEEFSPESTWSNVLLLFWEGGPQGGPVFLEDTPTAYDPSIPVFSANFVHDHIDIVQDNHFPLQGNLPDIGQWEFIRSCCAIYGLKIIVKNEVLHIEAGANGLDKSRALDWSGKISDNMGDATDVSYTIPGWAKHNQIKYKEDDKETESLPFSPDAVLKVEDQTLTDSRDYIKLPFAASARDVAIHYEIKGNELNDVDIAPRIFRIDYINGEWALTSPEDLYGQAMISRYYQQIQDIIEKPIVLSTQVRLNEVDLKGLDLSVPVYLRQFGKYYAILRVQTSKTDICKVELLQLP